MNKTILSMAILAVMGAGAGGYLYLENEKAKVESQAKLEQMEAELKAKADAVLEAQQAALQAQAVIGEQQKAIEEARIKAEIEAQEKAQAQAQTQAQVEAQSAPIASGQAVPVVAKEPVKVDVSSPDLKQGILFELKASDAVEFDESNNYSKLKPSVTFARVVSTDGKLNIPKFRDETQGVAYYKLGDKADNASSTLFSASFSAKESGLVRIVTGAKIPGQGDNICKAVNSDGDSVVIDSKDYAQSQTLKFQANAGQGYQVNCKNIGYVFEQKLKGYTVKIEQKVGDEWSTQNLFYKPVTEGIATIAPDLDSEQKARLSNNAALIFKQSDSNGQNKFGYNGDIISSNAFDASAYEVKELAKSISEAFSSEKGFNKLVEFGIAADKSFDIILVPEVESYNALSKQVAVAKKRKVNGESAWDYAKNVNILANSNTFSMHYDVASKGVYPVRIFIDGTNALSFKVFILREGDTQATQLKMSDVYIRASDKDKFKTVDKKNAPADMM